MGGFGDEPRNDTWSRSGVNYVSWVFIALGVICMIKYRQALRAQMVAARAHQGVVMHNLGVNSPAGNIVSLQAVCGAWKVCHSTQ